MKGLILSIFTLTFSYGQGQDSVAYALFNSSYAADHYTLVDKADSYFVDTAANNTIMQECKRIVPKSLLKTMIDKKSIPFKWDKTKLQKTNVISDTTSSKDGKQYLILSSPIFDSTKTFALIYETFDAISCIHSGPVLFQYKGKKWKRVASQIASYHLARGLTVPREQQCDLIVAQLPDNFKNGLIIYPQNDSTYFVFRAADYIKIYANDSLPLIKSDSVDAKNFLNFTSSLKRAKSDQCTLLNAVKYKDSKMFPNDFVLKELFSSRDIFVLKNITGIFKKIDYKTEKHKGKNVKWHFTVIQKQNNSILFKTAYGTIYN